MGRFPLSEMIAEGGSMEAQTNPSGLLSQAPAEPLPPEPVTAEVVKAPADKLSAVLQDERDGGAPRPGMAGKAVEVMRTIFDPEIPVNIYDLGLIYDVVEREPGKIFVTMTLTSPMCPVAGSLPPDVKNRISAVTGADDVQVDVVWDPAWGPEMMSEAARLQLNMF